MKTILTIAFTCFIGITVNAQDLEIYKANDGKYGYKEKTGKVIIPAKYTQCYPFEGNFAVVRSAEGKEALIDRTGKQTTKYYNDIIQDRGFQYQGRFIVADNNKFSIIDSAGNQIIQKAYEMIFEFTEDGNRVRLNGKYGFIDLTGKEVVPCKYDWIGEAFYEGFAVIKQGDKYGFIDKSGKEIVPCIYDLANNFSDGMAAVNLGFYELEAGYWGFVDKLGQLIIPVSYDFVYEGFKDGKVKVRKGFETFYIDKKGSKQKN